MGVLGHILTSPFRMANMPFKGYRQYYGKPKKTDKYTGNILQKERVKKIIPRILKGLEISLNDKLFMDMFNDFLSAEGHEPMDQHGIDMRCKECLPYIYKSSGGQKYTKPKKEEKKETKQKIKSVMSFSFNNEIKPKNSTNHFNKGGIYYLSFLGKRVVGGKLELMFKNRWFKDEDDFLIFRTESENPFGIYSYFEVYQDNKEKPLKTPIFLGNASIKIE